MTGEASPAASVVAPFLAAAHRRWLADDTGIGWRRRPASVVYGTVSGLSALAGTGELDPGTLSELLNGAAGRLFDTAATHGGDLLRCSSDSLLVAFDGPGHERRAVQAAAALPLALRGLPGETAGLELDVAIGVATGELDLFLVGDDHRELVVCGPLVSTAVRLERAARSGDVLADGPTAAAVNDARWSGPHGGGHVLLLPPPASTVGLGVSVNGAHEVPAAELLRGIPTRLRAHLGSNGQGTHRPVAVACIQVTGVDDLLDRAGPAAVADALDAVIGTAQAACAAHGATFLTTGADDGAVTLTLAAGAPEAGADSVGRLLLATRKVAAGRGELLLRAGVHRGRTFVVEVGSTRRRAYSLVGDPVHVAAQLMRQAEPGAVLATDHSLAASGTRFEARPLEALAANGAREHVGASVVGAPLGEGAYRSAGRGPLVGRDVERGALLDALDEVRNGASRVVLVTGDPGIGKSRLVAEVIAAAPDLPRLHVTGTAVAVDHPYAVLRAPLRRLLDLDAEAGDDDVLAALAGAVGTSGAPWLPLLAPAFGVTPPDTTETAAVASEQRPTRSRSLLTTLLRRLLPDRSLLVVEDAHWLDRASTELLQRVLGGSAEAPWLVLVSRRNEVGGLDLEPAGVTTHVDLQPLDLHAAAALLDDSADDRLLHRGRGNPLLLEQLHAAVAAGADVDGLPDTLDAVVTARIRALDPVRRRQLRAASVLGTRFPARLLARLLPDAASDLVSLAGLLEPDEPGWIRFHHPLVWERAHAGLSRADRRDLHARVGELLEADPSACAGHADLLSFHHSEGQRWAQAWRWSLRAAERSAAMCAPVETAGFLRRALRAAGHLDVDAAELCWVYERLADAEVLNRQLQAAADALTRARRLTDDAVRSAHLLHRHGCISDREGSFAAAQRWFSRGLRELANAPPSAAGERVRIDLVIAQAGTKVHQGRRREAAVLLEGAVADATAIGHVHAASTAAHQLSLLAGD